MQLIHPIEKLVPPAFTEAMPNVMPSAAVVVVEYVTDEGKHELFWMADDRSPLWANLGMAVTLVEDLKALLRAQQSGGG